MLCIHVNTSCNNNNNINDSVYSLSSWQAITRVHSVHTMSTAWRQVAANLWTKPTRLSHRPDYRQPYPLSPFIIITQPKS